MTAHRAPQRWPMQSPARGEFRHSISRPTTAYGLSNSRNQRRLGVIQPTCPWDARPFFHVGALAGLLGCIVAGAKYCTLPFFDVDAAVSQIAEEHITVAWPVYDTIWQRVIGHPRFAEADVSSLRAIGLVGHAEALRAVQRRFPHASVVSSYGSTECNPAAFARPGDAAAERMNSVGRPAPGVEIRSSILLPGWTRPLAPAANSFIGDRTSSSAITTIRN